MNNIAILLTVHNRREKTLTCLENIYSQHNIEDLSIKVFMTDDGCTDGTTESVNKKYPDVMIIHGDGNLFWNRGMFLAWQTAQRTDNYDFILWLNDDTKLMNDSISRLIKFSDVVKNKSIIVGSTLESENNPVFSYGGKTSGIKQSPLYPDDDKLKKCTTFNGNIVLIPKFVYEKCGIIDNYFHHSFGDVEYGFRTTKNGIINYIAPGYYGYCVHNNPIPIFRRKCFSLIKRYKLLYSPLGYNPMEAFYMNRKYFSFLSSLWFSIKLHINVLFPIDHTKYNK